MVLSLLWLFRICITAWLSFRTNLRLPQVYAPMYKIFGSVAKCTSSQNGCENKHYYHTHDLSFDDTSQHVQEQCCMVVIFVEYDRKLSELLKTLLDPNLSLRSLS